MMEKRWSMLTPIIKVCDTSPAAPRSSLDSGAPMPTDISNWSRMKQARPPTRPCSRQTGGAKSRSRSRRKSARRPRHEDEALAQTIDGAAEQRLNTIPTRPPANISEATVWVGCLKMVTSTRARRSGRSACACRTGCSASSTACTRASARSGCARRLLVGLHGANQHGGNSRPPAEMRKRCQSRSPGCGSRPGSTGCRRYRQLLAPVTWPSRRPALPSAANSM